MEMGEICLFPCLLPPWSDLCLRPGLPVWRDAASILVLDSHYLPVPDEAYDYTSL